MKLSQQTMDFINSPDLLVYEVPDELFIPDRFCPKTFKPVDMIKEYSLSREVRCIFGHNHSNGFIVVFEGDNNYAGMGPECAGKIFGKERCSKLTRRLQKAINQEKTEATIRPNLVRNNALLQLLPQLCDVAKDKDAFFAALYDKDIEFVKALKIAALSAGFGEPTIVYDTLPSINYARRHLQSSSEFYSMRPVVESNTAKGEDHYFRAKRNIGALLEDLAAGQRFFLPGSLATVIHYVVASRAWKGRVEMTATGLRVDDYTFAVPMNIPYVLEELEGTIAEIRKVLERPLSEFQLAA